MLIKNGQLNTKLVEQKSSYNFVANSTKNDIITDNDANAVPKPVCV